MKLFTRKKGSNPSFDAADESDPRLKQAMGRSQTTPIQRSAPLSPYHFGGKLALSSENLAPSPVLSPGVESRMFPELPSEANLEVSPFAATPPPLTHDERILAVAQEHAEELFNCTYGAEETAAVHSEPVPIMTDKAASALDAAQLLVKSVMSLRVPGSLLSSKCREAGSLALGCKDLRKRKDEFERQAKKVRDLVAKMNSVSRKEEMAAVKETTMAMAVLRERAENVVGSAQVVIELKAHVARVNAQEQQRLAVESSSLSGDMPTRGRANTTLALPQSVVPPRESSLEHLRNGGSASPNLTPSTLEAPTMRQRANTDVGRGRSHDVVGGGTLAAPDDPSKKRSVSPLAALRAPTFDTLKGMLPSRNRRPSAPDIAVSPPSSRKGPVIDTSLPAIPDHVRDFQRRPSAPTTATHKRLSGLSKGSNELASPLSATHPNVAEEDVASDSSSLLSNPQDERDDVDDDRQDSAVAGMERRFTNDLELQKMREAAEAGISEEDEELESDGEASDHSLLPDSDDDSYIDSEEERARMFAASKVRKASKFLGMDEEEVQDVQVTVQVEREWYLNYDYKPKDVTINMEGDVTGGTVDALIERLTIHDMTPDPNFCKAFFLCFRLFVSSVVLVDKLKARFHLQPPAELTDPDLIAIWTEKKKIPVQFHVYNAIKMWAENYWIPDEDDDALEDIHAFLEDEEMDVMPGIDELADLIDRLMELDADDPTKPKLASLRSKKDATEKFGLVAAPAVINFKVPANPLDVEPVEIANQLTLMDSRLFNAITPRELVGQEWTRKKGSLAVNVRAMSTLATQITTWVQEVILFEEDIKKRANAIKYFMKVADRCLAVNNYDTLFAVMTALNISSVQRLKKTWKLLTPKYMALYDKLKAASDHSRNYAEYRKMLKELGPPCLPFMGMYLTDLTFIDDGNAAVKRTSDADRVMINFGKYLQTVRLLNDLQRFQVDNAYQLPDNPNLQLAIKRWVENSFTGGDENNLYQQSLKVEPRGS